MAFQTDDGVSKTDVWVSAAEGGVRVVALWDAHVVTKKLSAGGVYTVGRAPECEVRVDHPSVSRRHARLHVGDVIRIEDLGSANGTIVGRTRLAPSSTVDWTPGDLLVIGATTLFLQSTEQSRDELVPSVSRAPASPWPESGAMGRIARVLALVAPGDITVLLLGETGVGKELAAETVHRLSRRAEQPFVRLNCAALPENLLESELFGYERGAFTGADKQKPGLLEGADKGTVFLDEIGELPLPTQAKLLRVLESREVTRLGSVTPKKIDVRFVAATNRDLGDHVARGGFRKDLLFRLSGMPVHIPALRERREEILPLARRFAAESAAHLGRAGKELTPRAIAALEGHSWPGNVRELRNVMERALLLSEQGPIDAEHLALELGTTPVESGAPASITQPSVVHPSGELDLKKAMAEFEKAQIERALSASGGNQTRAAELLGISRRALVTKLGEYGLTHKKPR
ncbi:MAG: sigma 54-interacting transcriptional regulator [Polyangiaceae bacterium]|nr:sigma 54-interacting transcriptional regulator [Polyangiaceae bacterium]MCE7894542.1 FHA domain-containing protein [Sorangiineae bacterium PRO1]MCL4756143.1 sigma 54-interacting transcriptional regulator [Myxococcales bacterium]